jgi:hypothetical protein
MISLVPSASAAQISARLTMLFDGGTRDLGDHRPVGAPHAIAVGSRS